MLRIDTSTAFSYVPKTKCAEIFYQNEANFSIVCVICQMKTFNFSDFLLHFKNVHLLEDAIKSEWLDTAESNGCDNNTTHEDDVDNFKSAVKSDVASKLFAFKKLDGVERLSPDVEYADEEWCPDSDENSTGGEETISCVVSPEKQTRHAKTKNVETTSAKSTNCPQCGKQYKSLKYLQIHLKVKHSAAAIAFPCDRCAKTFPNETALEGHTRSKHTGYPCPDCGKVYKSKVVMTDHRYKHTGVRQFACKEPDCGKAFFYPKQLHTHSRLVHSGFWKYVCETCGQRFKMNCSLVVHMRSHTGERPFKCKECQKGFASSSLLAEHMPIHSSERPHKCDVCGRAFSRPKALYHHKHLHLEVKKFMCVICGKAYAQAAGLCGHMRQHKTD